MSEIDTYLGRPVFRFQANWETDPSMTHDYDVRSVSIGFGSQSFGQLQFATARTHSFTCEFVDADALSDFESWCDALLGRANGFWIAHPLRTVEITAGVSSTQFDIKDQSIRDTLSDDATTHFLFIKPDGSKVAAKCTAAASASATTERLTVDTDLGGTPDSQWRAYRFLYVRFASDEESGTLWGESRQTRSIKVVELPTEYQEIETGTTPVFLYRFFLKLENGDENSWYYTSAPADITSNSIPHTTRNINHGSVRYSTKASDSGVQIDADFDPAVDPDAPWGLYLPFASSLPLWVEIKSALIGAPDATTTVFVGRIGPSPEFEGRRVTMQFSTWASSLGAMLPRPLIGPRCPLKLGEPNTCKKDLSALTLTPFIESQSGNYIVVADASLSGLAENWFANGWVTFSVGQRTQSRAVLSSSAESAGSVTLRILQRFVGVENGSQVTLVPGCDKSPATCADKFENYDNFGGRQYVPRQNLTLQAIEVATSGGAKK